MIGFPLQVGYGAGVVANPDFPEAANVLTSDYTNGVQGTYISPAAGAVLVGAVWGPGGNSAGLYIQALVGDVQEGVTFGASSDQTGTFVSPLPSVVVLGVEYGALAEFTGTYPAFVTDDTDVQRSDTAAILVLCGEVLTIQRRSNTWSDGIATSTWNDIDDIAGEWQPVTGDVRKAEVGLNVQSVAQVYTLVDIDVEEDDKIVRADGTFLYVNYVEKQSDHWVLRLKVTEPISD